MQIETFSVGLFASNCYVVHSERTGDAIIVDPGDEPERILAFLAEKSLEVRRILCTHAHIDHIAALAPLLARLDVPTAMHEEERLIYENMPYQAALFGLEPPRPVEVGQYLRDGDEITIGKERGKVIHTPGHSPGSVSFLFPHHDPPVIFSGDTLFRGSIGRTDIFGGDYHQIINSLRSCFLALPDETVVYAGHGDPTTIGDERRENPFLADL